MHSFETEYNEVSWKLKIEAEIAGWPKLERNSPIVVRPSAISELHYAYEKERKKLG
jgi:hypothetical protein